MYTETKHLFPRLKYLYTPLQHSKLSIFYSLNLRWVRDTNFQDSPSTGSCDTADIIHSSASQVSIIVVRS
jgi:hypothetical protein